MAGIKAGFVIWAYWERGIYSAPLFRRDESRAPSVLSRSETGFNPVPFGSVLTDSHLSRVDDESGSAVARGAAVRWTGQRAEAAEKADGDVNP